MPSQWVQRAVGLKAQRAALSALRILTATLMVLVCVMMTGHRKVLPWRNSAMLIALSTWENAGQTVASAPDQSSTTVTHVKSTEPYKVTAPVYATPTGLAKIAANTMACVTRSVTDVRDQDQKAVSTVSPTLMKMAAVNAYVSHGIKPEVIMDKEPGRVIAVTHGTAPALMLAPAVQMDTCLSNAQNAMRTPSLTRTVSVNVTLTGQDTTVANTSENVTHVVTAVTAQPTMTVMPVQSMQRQQAQLASVSPTSQDQTAHCTRQTVTPNVTDATTIPVRITKATLTTTAFTV